MLDFLSILKEYGWKGLLLATILFLVHRFIIGWVTVVIDKIKLKMLENKQERLSMHEFFSTIIYFLNVEVYSINMFPDKPVRQNLARDLTYCTLSSIHDVAEKIVKTNDETRSNVEWAFRMRSYINEMHTLFIEKCIKKGIPELIYLKYTEWYFERLAHLRIMIDRISASNDYPNINSKTSTLLMLCLLFVETTIHDSESALRELNGEISGMTYSGGTIEALDH